MPSVSGVVPYVGLAVVGVAVGAYGTLIGAGGGFVLVPILLLLYPHESAAQITATSLAVVFANSVSGSISYYRLRRADYRSGIWLAIATLPGAVLGALVVSAIPRRAFDITMGLALVIVAGYLTLRPRRWIPLPFGGPLMVDRAITDSTGRSYAYRFNLGVAMMISVVIGFLSSLLGIGGGIIHVPVLTTFFAFPEHVATATSHFVLVFTSGAGTWTHIAQGDYSNNIATTVALAVGVLAGAPLGAQISSRVGGRLIVRLLAVALGVVGVRVLIAAFAG